MTNSKKMTGMQQNAYIASLVEKMERGREYTAKQMAELLKITPKTMSSLIHKMRAHEVIIKTGSTRQKRRTPTNLWKLNPIKMPRWVNLLV